MDSRTDIEDRPWSNSSVWRTSTSRAVPNPHFNKRIKLLKIREKKKQRKPVAQLLRRVSDRRRYRCLRWVSSSFLQEFGMPHRAKSLIPWFSLQEDNRSVTWSENTHKEKYNFFFMTEQIETPWSDRVSNWPPPPCRCPILERKPAKPENKGRSSVLDYDSNSITIGKKVCSYARL